MYDRLFFASPLGKAALASIAAMTAMIALSSQMMLDSGSGAIAGPGIDLAHAVELA